MSSETKKVKKRKRNGDCLFGVDNCRPAKGQEFACTGCAKSVLILDPYELCYSLYGDRRLPDAKMLKAAEKYIGGKISGSELHAEVTAFKVRQTEDVIVI